MSPEEGTCRRVMTAPRPGHADLPGMLKYQTHDARDILERASARETAARTVAGYVSKLLLAEVGITILSHVVQMRDDALELAEIAPGRRGIRQALVIRGGRLSFHGSTPRMTVGQTS